MGEAMQKTRDEAIKGLFRAGNYVAKQCDNYSRHHWGKAAREFCDAFDIEYEDVLFRGSDGDLPAFQQSPEIAEAVREIIEAAGGIEQFVRSNFPITSGDPMIDRYIRAVAKYSVMLDTTAADVSIDPEPTEPVEIDASGAEPEDLRELPPLWSVFRINGYDRRVTNIDRDSPDDRPITTTNFTPGGVSNVREHWTRLDWVGLIAIGATRVDQEPVVGDIWDPAPADGKKFHRMYVYAVATDGVIVQSIIPNEYTVRSKWSRAQWARFSATATRVDTESESDAVDPAKTQDTPRETLLDRLLRERGEAQKRWEDARAEIRRIDDALMIKTDGGKWFAQFSASGVFFRLPDGEISHDQARDVAERIIKLTSEVAN